MLLFFVKMSPQIGTSASGGMDKYLLMNLLDKASEAPKDDDEFAGVLKPMIRSFVIS